jgi:protein-L-isoaspartate(D-aspartate) O-methyltransferase
MRRDWQGLADRRLFIPDTIWTLGDDGWLVPVRRCDDPDAWEARVAADEPIITQVDDGAGDGERGSDPTSSSSAPWLMARMLDALDLAAGMRVLEIGTGTGWNAALLAAAGAIVTTVEIDEELAARARRSLAMAGYQDVVVVCGDGERGVPEHAPYDRVLATAAVHTVPYAWVRQTVEGGVLVVPYTGRHHPCGLAVLTVTAGTASGRIVDDETTFMPVRGQRLGPRELREIGPPVPGLRIEVGPDGQRHTTPAT